MQEAQWYKQTKNNQVICHLCPHHCRLQPGAKGICRVRYNEGGKLYTSNYGQCSQPVLDPIEKKPLYHYYPGSLILSVGTFGCNLQCPFCQNWHLAHQEPLLYRVEPTELVEMAELSQKDHSLGLAYTYSEPFVWFEFVLDTAKLAHERGLKNVLVSNGFIEAEPLEQLLPVIDAFNLDIKGFTEDFYRKIVKGNLRAVLNSAEQVYKNNKHLEITTLLIPGLNDSKEELEQLVKWIANNLGKEVPVHFSRYLPNYQMDLPPTTIQKLEEAREIGLKHLDYVYLGNVPGSKGSSTYCPQCGRMLIERRGHQAKLTNLKGINCGSCGYKLNLIK